MVLANRPESGRRNSKSHEPKRKQTSRAVPARPPQRYHTVDKDAEAAPAAASHAPSAAAEATDGGGAGSSALDGGSVQSRRLGRAGDDDDE
ncbi:MAG: hypothetical protein VX109_05375, partial [Planctomycetota bacterium]|nr:hypothetical protein [Planctomycetota bacterium]